MTTVTASVANHSMLFTKLIFNKTGLPKIIGNPGNYFSKSIIYLTGGSQLLTEGTVLPAGPVVAFLGPAFFPFPSVVIA
jgi:hypothetical protein